MITRLKFAIVIAWGLFVASCLSAPVTLTWDANPQPVANYEVWRGIEKLATVELTEADLDIPEDRLTTLQVIAVGLDGQRSAPSIPITVQPFHVDTSTDLTTWESCRTEFREFTDKAFFRIHYITK